jgi:tetratricopeptide (TPR) repeat protein
VKVNDETIELHARRHTVGFGVVKELVARCRPDGWDEPARLGLRVVLPTADHRPGTRASLTDSARYDDQIRFFLKDRSVRAFRNVAQAMARQLGPVTVHVARADALDEGSRLFLRELAVGAGVTVLQAPGAGAGPAPPSLRSPDGREERIHLLVTAGRALDDDEAAFLKDEAKRYVNVGDAWTAERLLMRLLDRSDPQVDNMLGLVHTMLGQTVQAEFFYRRWRRSPQPGDRPRADYALAMLYARHHPPALRDLDRTAALLEEAHGDLLGLTPDDLPDLAFETVFNRNGYALVLFRRGQVDEAIALLESGIRSLPGGRDGVYLHRTVLMYNLAQCYKALGRLGDAVTTYRQLLEVDGFMPEYRMELARCLLDADLVGEAATELETAAAMDPAIAECWSLLGFARMATGDLGGAATAWARAYTQAGERADVAYDHAWALAEQGRYDEALAVAGRVELVDADPAVVADVCTVAAEAAWNLGDAPGARAWVARGLSRAPGHEQLLANRDLLADTTVVTS